MTADIGHATEETQLAGARQDSKSEGMLAVNGEDNVGVMAVSDFVDTKEVVMTVVKEALMVR